MFIKKKNIFKNIDKTIFIGTILLLLSLIIPILILDGSEVSDQIINFITSKFGWLYLLYGFSCIAIGIWLMYGKYGKVKFGEKNEKKEFSNFAWTAMMFTAGLGVGIVILSFVEPIQFLTEPPLGITPKSDKAYEFAHMMGQFHYGPTCWAIYAVPTIAVAYSIYVKKRQKLSISSACESAFKKPHKLFGKLIDIFVMFGIIGGLATCLGTGIPVLSLLISNLFHIPNNLILKICVLGIWLLIFGSSVYLGLEKGIKHLSNFNIYLCIALLLYVFIIGPTMLCLKLEINSIGLLLQNFTRLSFWTDPIANTGFSENWTVFYWAWWLAVTPMMAMFVARISKGRTIKETVGGMIIYGSLGCMLSYGIFGAYALNLQKTGAVDLISLSSNEEIMQAILNSMPLSKVVIVAFIILVFVFLATTIDSTAFILGSVTTKNLKANQQPARWNRLFWAFALMGLSLVMVIVGGMEIVKMTSILTSLPLLFINAVLFKGFITDIRQAKEVKTNIEEVEKHDYSDSLAGETLINAYEYKTADFVPKKYDLLSMKIEEELDGVEDLAS